MRIIAGSAKGRPLETPGNAEGVRPTADRVRETIFNVLGQWMDDLKVLDLFAGTGGLGLEAVSRGATRLVLVDRDTALCERNVKALGFEAQCTVIRSTVVRALEQLAAKGERFDVIFSDPPYADEAAATVLALALPLLNEGGRLVIEHSKREVVTEERRIDQRKFGDTLVSIFQ